MAEGEELELKNFVQSIMKEKGVSMIKLSDRVDKSQASLSTCLGRNRLNMKTFFDIMKALDEDFEIILKNGNKYKIVIK